MNRPQLEVCVASVEDAMIALAGGADRVELNSALELGGLTPSYGRYQLIRERTPHVAVMIRPRAAGFDYSAVESQEMIADVERFSACPPESYVCGFLKADGTIDSRRLRQFQEAAGAVGIVFSRAFDLVPNPQEALDELICCGVQRVMTSGQSESAIAGSACISELVQQSTGRIEILPAGGITVANVRQLVLETGCTQVHASLRWTCQDLSACQRPHVRFGKASQNEIDYRQTNINAVRAMRLALDDISTRNHENSHRDPGSV